MLPVGFVLGAASGAAMLALGLAVLRLAPRQLPSMSFGVFAALWGAAVAVGNLASTASDARIVLAGGFVLVALYIPLAAVMVVAVGSITAPSARHGMLLRLGAVGTPAALLLILLAAEPSLFLTGAQPVAGGWAAQAGPLFVPTIVLASVVAFVVALFALARRLRVAEGEAARGRLALVTAAFLAYVSYRAGDILSSFDTSVDFETTTSAATFAIRLLARLGAVATVAYAAWTAYRDIELPWRRLILWMALVPFAARVGELLLQAGGVANVDTVGLWRLMSVALFAYAIGRHHLFDVELRMRNAAPAAALVAGAVAGLFALWAAVGAQLVERPAVGALASVGVVAACVPLARWTDGALARAAPHVLDPDHLYKRKVDVYRAALEDSEAGGMGERTEDLFLSDLRRRLGISEDEHRILLLVVRSQSKYGRRDAPLAPPASAAAQKYEIVRELGRGAAGRVVLARDRALEREVVLKQPLAPWLLDERGRELFLQEARLAARVRHPHVVAVHDVMMDADPPLIVMEHVRGGSLEKLLEPRAKLDPPRAARLMLDVLDGLAAVHAAGIVHRDLKPSNVLLEPDGVAKVADFGIARPPAASALAATLSGTAGQPGSIAYMSPEQARGDDVDARTDLYACGALLYRMLTGQHYVDLGRASEAKARALVIETPPRLPHPEVPAAFERLLHRALAKDADARYASAGEMASDLRHAVGAVRVPVLGPEPLADPTPPS